MAKPSVPPKPRPTKHRHLRHATPTKQRERLAEYLK